MAPSHHDYIRPVVPHSFIHHTHTNTIFYYYETGVVELVGDFIVCEEGKVGKPISPESSLSSQTLSSHLIRHYR